MRERTNRGNPKGIGRQNLRFQTLMFSLWILIFTVILIFISNHLAQYDLIQWGLRIEAGIAGIIWLIILPQLWRYERSGRTGFLLYTLLYMGTLYEGWLLYQGILGKEVSQQLRYFLIGCAVLGNLANLWFLKHLYFDDYIACLWNEDLLDEFYEEENDIVEVPLPPVKETMLEKKAKGILRRYTVLVILYLFGSLLLFYVLMFGVAYQYPDDLDGIWYVQRLLLLSCLFSSFAWSFAVIGMMLYRRWTRVMVVLAIVLEIVRWLANFTSIQDVFLTQHYGLPSLISLIVLQLLRYFLLFKIWKGLLSNPFVNAYWSDEYHHER